MEFGRAAVPESVEWTLPPDDKMTTEMLTAARAAGLGALHLHVGCARWGNKEWVGKVYPQRTKDKDFLQEYVRQFNCIELNALFYHLQPAEVIEKWASLAGEGFRYCPKFSNSITHTKQLYRAEQDTGLFVERMRHFGSKLGPSFLQLADSFDGKRAADLRHYLHKLPRDFAVAVELRHPDWFAVRPSREVVDSWELLCSLGIGTVITDTIGRRDVVHMRLTSPVAFIRFVGNDLHPSDFSRIDTWVERIRNWIDAGLREIYFFVHTHEEVNSPVLAKYAIERFNLLCGTRLKAPRRYDENLSQNLSLF